MGMFDEVLFRCPACGGTAAVQSKAGDCSLTYYNANDVPRAIAADVLGKVADCGDCGRSFRVRTRVEIPAVIPLELES